jgi:hypothetical protein
MESQKRIKRQYYKPGIGGIWLANELSYKPRSNIKILYIK